MAGVGHPLRRDVPRKRGAPREGIVLLADGGAGGPPHELAGALAAGAGRVVASVQGEGERAVAHLVLHIKTRLAGVIQRFGP